MNGQVAGEGIPFVLVDHEPPLGKTQAKIDHKGEASLVLWSGNGQDT
jgi:hypothetical protein